jgi:hypothetical protein
MNQSASNIFTNSLKSILKNLLKICAIAFAWIMKLTGTMLTKMGEALERIIIKRSSL